MAKRSNNFRNKKLQAPKPYDVSNSFVKKVASRVTELLPQSIWPTNWFSSSDPEVQSLGDGRKILNSPHVLEKNDGADQNLTPHKRARIPLDSSFTVFNTSTSASDYETRRLRNPSPSSDMGDGEAIAGPSGIHQKYSVGKLEPPKPKSRDTFCYHAKSLEVNGEDHSDSSESTSGCSSLPQGDHNVEIRNSNQPKTSELQINGPDSVNRTSLKRRCKEGVNYSSMAVNTTHLFSGFGGYTSPSRAAPVPVGRRRNPSFNPDAFGPQNWSGEKTNIKDRIVNSPFYSGRTTYGGVSAYQSNLNRTENQFAQSGRRNIHVCPVKTTEVQGGSSGMSNTARRILEALEMFSSPIQDAKKIPVSGSVSIKRRKVLVNSDISQTSLPSPRSSTMLTQDTGASVSHRLGDFTPPVRELVVPTVPDILAMRRRQKLQGSTVAAREVANESNILPFSVEKISEQDSYPWPCSDNRSGRFGGKVKSKEDIGNEPVEEPDLPNVALPITSLPKFDFTLPPVCPPTYKPSDSSMFKFSSPIAFSSASEALVSSSKFTFSSPLKAISKDSCGNSDPSIDLGCTTESVQMSSKTKKTSKDTSIKKSIEKKEKVWDTGWVSTECNAGLKVHSENVGFQSVVQGNSNNLGVSVGSSLSGKGTFGEQFKPAAGSWECETCMVRNSCEMSKCVACETPGSLKDDGLRTIKTHTGTKSGFGNSFKPPSGSWTCDVCMIHNPSSANKCQACETHRPKGLEVSSTSESSKALGSGFGDKFKKVDGDWDCAICLVRNKSGGPPKCVACEAPKPGTEPLVTMSASSTKFSSGDVADSGFHFGIDKAGDVPKKNCSGEVKSTFTFGSSNSAGSTGFIFGRQMEGEAKVSGFTFGTSATSESTDSDHSKNTSVPKSSPNFVFGSKEMVSGRAVKLSTPESIQVHSKSESKVGGDTDDKSLVAKSPKEPEYKFGVGATTKISADIVTSGAPSKLSVVAEVKPAFTFSATEDKKDPVTAIHNFGSNLSSAKLKEGSIASMLGNATSPVSNLSPFGAVSNVASWSSSPLFKLDSSPKTSLNSQTTTSTLPTNNTLEDKHEESLKAGPSTFRFGDTSKVDTKNCKQLEVPKVLSSSFKFQEPPKTTSPIFNSDDKLKTSLSSMPAVTLSTIASNPFPCTVFSSSNPDKTTEANEELNKAAVSSVSASVDSAVLKSSNAEPVFMFGSGSNSAATAFNLVGQKQPSQTVSNTKDEQIEEFSNPGTAPNVFGNLSSSKALVFGSTQSAPTHAVTSLPAATAASDTRSITAFASPASNPVFGISVTASVTSTSTATTSTASSTSAAFGSSIFGSASFRGFPAAASPTTTFGSSTSTPLAETPAFGVAPSSSAVFGASSSTSIVPFSFSGGAKSSSDEQQPLQPTNAPFVFGGGGSTPSAQPFNFNAATRKLPFNVGSSAQLVAGTNASAPAPAAAPALGGFSFGDASKGGSTPFGSAQPVTSAAGAASSPFGSSSALSVARIPPAASSFCTPSADGSAAASGTFGTPAFNFGSSQPNPMFSFSNNQQGSVLTNISQPSGFNFGQASQAGSAIQQVTFNPNVPPSFNFTGGATPQFTATPGGLNPAATASNVMQRRFKKAVRRSQQPR